MFYHTRHPSWKHPAAPSPAGSSLTLDPLIDASEPRDHERTAQRSGAPSYAPSVETLDLHERRAASLPAASDTLSIHMKTTELPGLSRTYSEALSESTRIGSAHESFTPEKGTAAPSVAVRRIENGKSDDASAIDQHSYNFQNSKLCLQSRNVGALDVSKTRSMDNCIRELSSIYSISALGSIHSPGGSTPFY